MSCRTACSAADFLDLRSAVLCCGEQGLLSLVFPPDAATSNRFYVNFTSKPDGNTVVARFTRSGDPLVADPTSRFDLVWPDGQAFIEQPFGNHNGGHMAFGPDGFLYIGLGDGGSGNDPGHRAQNPQSLLGKILRIDVNVPDANTKGYVVPASNPFVDHLPITALTEIWAFGMRNPWRFTFDDVTRGGTGALVIGDVGQDNWEEIDYEPAARRRPQLRLAQPRGQARHARRPHQPRPRLHAADRSDLRVLAQWRRRLDHRRLRLPRHRARPELRRPLFLRRLRPGPAVVPGAHREPHDPRGDRIGSARAHRGARRGRRRQLVGRGRRRRAVRRRLRRHDLPRRCRKIRPTSA